MAIALVASAHIPSASADTVQGEVARMWIRADNVLHFRLKGETCKVQTAGANPFWTFSLNTVAGKAWFDMLLASAYAGKPVKVSTPACSTTSSQSVRYVYQDYGTATPEQTPAPNTSTPSPTPPSVPTNPASNTDSPTQSTPSVPATPPTGIPTVPGSRPNAVFN